MIRLILCILISFLIVYMTSTCSDKSSTTLSQVQKLKNKFPNVKNLEEEAIISNEISEDLLLTMIKIVKLHGNSCQTVSAASRSYDGSTFNLKCNLYINSYNLKNKGGEWYFEVER